MLVHASGLLRCIARSQSGAYGLQRKPSGNRGESVHHSDLLRETIQRTKTARLSLQDSLAEIDCKKIQNMPR
jgi:hypothetical protein